MMNCQTGPASRLNHATLKAAAAAIVLAFGATPAAYAGEIDTGNADMAVRWDNTVRYTYGQRVGRQDPLLIGPGSQNIDDGNRNFGRGDATANRLDLLTELDLVYQQRHGLRLSAAAWNDLALKHTTHAGQALNQSNHLDANGKQAFGLSPTTERFGKGPSGELLDAFLFTGFDVGDARVSVKAGQHTVYWGEALYNFSNSISYSQMSVDLAKALQMPGAETKEVFRPRNSVSMQAQVSPSVSLAAQKFLDWKPYRLPNPGSYLGFADMVGDGAESMLAAPGAPLARGANITPGKNKDWGLALRWSPDALDGTLGLYYRKYTDMQPAVFLQPGGTLIASQVLPKLNANPGLVAANGGPFTVPGYLGGAYNALLARNPATAPLQSGVIAAGAPAGFGKYYQAYADNVDLFGLSLAKNIGSVSTSMEMSYRKNTPLVSFPVYVVNKTFAAVAGATNPTLVSVTGVPGGDDLPVARGNTLHMVVNGLGLISSTALFDSASWGAELAFAHLDKVTANAGYYKGIAPYTGIDKPTTNAFALTVNMAPTWFSVFPSADLSLPMAFSAGIRGNAPTSGTMNKGQGSWSIGARIDYAQKYQFELRFVSYLGQAAYGPTYTGAPAALTTNGSTAGLRDRDQVLFTFKTTL